MPGCSRNLDDPRHVDHFKDYVQNYIADYGVHKCEANALVTAPAAGRQLCCEAILQYIDANALDEYHESLQESHDELQQAIYDEFGVGEPPEDPDDDPDDDPNDDGPDEGGPDDGG
jgi:hypothetical protein